MFEDTKAISILQEARQNHGPLFDDEATNLLTELLLNNKMYRNALDVGYNHGNILYVHVIALIVGI